MAGEVLQLAKGAKAGHAPVTSVGRHAILCLEPMCKHNFCCAMSFCSSWRNRGAHSACPWCESSSDTPGKLCHLSVAGVLPPVDVFETCAQLHRRGFGISFYRAGSQKWLALWFQCFHEGHTGGCGEVIQSTAHRTLACASGFLFAGSHAQTSCASNASSRTCGRQSLPSIVSSLFWDLAFASYVEFAATSIQGQLPSELAMHGQLPKVPILVVLHSDVGSPHSVVGLYE